MALSDRCNCNAPRKEVTRIPQDDDTNDYIEVQCTVCQHRNWEYAID